MTDSTPRITRSRSPTEALAHVLGVLNNSKYNLIFREAGIEDIYDSMSVEIVDLKEVTAVDIVRVGANGTDPVIVQLKTAQLGKLKKLLEWIKSLNNLDYVAWFDLTNESLNDFIMGRGLVNDNSDTDSFHT